MSEAIVLPALPFKAGDVVMYKYPRRRLGFYIPPEKVTVKRIYDWGKASIIMRGGGRRTVKFEQLFPITS